MFGTLVDYSESLGESTSTSSTLTPKTSVTISAVSGVTYLAIWSCEIAVDDTGTTVEADLRINGAQRGLCRFRARDTTDYPRQGAIAVHTASSTASLTFDLNFRRQAGAGTAAIRNARLILLQLGEDDETASAVSNQQTSITTYVDALSLTFTPATSGDYLFLASGSVGNALTDIEFLSPAGTTVNLISDALTNDNAGYAHWGMMWKETLAASSSTAAIRWKLTSGTGARNLAYAYIVAIRIDKLRAAQSTQDDSPDGGTDTTYQTTESLAATGLTATTRDTVAIFSQTVSGNNTSYNAFMEAREAGVALTEGQHEPRGTTIRNAISAFLAYPVTSASASITFDLRRKSENAALTTTNDFAAIAVLEYPTSVDQALSANLTGTASIRKTVSKGIVAILASTASIVASTIFARTLAASLTATASIRKEVAKGLSATLDGVASIRKVVAKGLSATLASTALLAKAFPLRLVASLSASASIRKTVEKRLAAAATLTASMTRVKTAIVHMTATATMTASISIVRLFYRTLTATLTGTASIRRTISKRLVATQSMLAKPIAWIAYQFAAIRNDKPNWNQCPRCARKVRPNKMHQQMEFRGPRLVWTGLYVCHSCLDEPQQQGIWPRETGGDPKPVILARPRRD